ncbi:winged helix-turn-helix domain-containing protein [uncultured Boseongicola sp.]|uniref:winged helix-turn-helix domain-containing protein n=1 Tax=uncultured Boseongicola sp. TaxID=1648499 RepID=UPI002611DD55|nr:winged helix-turn-helix domain-containing protein [uncultured Boseongicola sp.]
MVARFDQFEPLDRTGDIVDPTGGEFRLLNIFLQNPKRVLSRDRLMDLLNGAKWSPLDRNIDNQKARLRRKIERDSSTPILSKKPYALSDTCSLETSRRRKYFSPAAHAEFLPIPLCHRACVRLCGQFQQTPDRVA